MLKSAAGINRNPNSAALIAFKPRQVVLLEHRTNTMTKKKQTETPSLTPDQKVSLLHSVILYLENNGFSKTLKRFLSEAQIQNEDWKASSLDLEDLYCKYLDTCNRAETNFNTCKEEELQSAGTAKEDANNICAVSEDILKKKKKKKSGENDISVSAYQSEATDKNLSDSVSAYQSEATDKNLSDSVKIPENVGYEEKSKGKKKSKKNSDSPDQNEQEHVETTESQQMIELTKKKDKKKKKNAPVSESLVKNVNPGKIESMEGVVEEQSKDSAPVESDSRKEKKSSKKRKRLISDESEHQPVGNEANEESKRRKTEDLEKSKKKDNLKIDDGGKENKHENEHENGNYEKNGDKCTSQKSMRKQRNGLAEPKTVNAFQRVKVDEVEFANEKLQDNSYWAKDGAEIGYGAKAQEVLGQVRGRDFRHEKTKKKRGSYRGGQIDQQSHSIKFNYSDED